MIVSPSAIIESRTDVFVELGSPEQIDCRLRTLRHAVDQEGGSFCLLLVDSFPAARFLELCRRLVSLPGEAGRFHDGQLALLLPDSESDGAAAHVADLIAAMEQASPATCRLYEYPCETYWERPHAMASRDSELVAPMAWLFARRTPTWKRMMDILGASMALVLFSPLFLLIAVTLLVLQGRPLLFAQERSGWAGTPFRMYKFRTMRRNAMKLQRQLRHANDQDGPAFKMKNDPRVTRIGKILRKLSLDELPQLFNVLTGDMSLVGPRPLPCVESRDCSVWQRRRLDVTPGLTCVWQVEGRSTVTFDEWMRMDLEYIERQSPIQDAKLIVRTIPAILSARGAY